MTNKKGQALIEFILVLPVLVMLIFSVIDFGRIFVNKNELETALGYINDIDKASIDYDSITEVVNKNTKDPITVEVTTESDGYMRVTLSRKINIITPGLNLILSSPYKVSTNRVVKYE